MTSHELTSGFDFWSRGHLRMTVIRYGMIYVYKVFNAQSNKNLAIANRSRVSCAHNSSRASP